MSSILLTGAAGYIGSHTAVEMIKAGHTVVIADNLSNSSASVIDSIEKITGIRPAFYEADVCRKEETEKIFEEHRIDGVIHFAGFKAVGESVQKPVEYYRNNLDSMLTVLETMKKFGVKKLVFSSSATVYGEANPAPYTETMPRGKCTNPYGQTKAMIEQILEDTAKADPAMSVVLLRYFNPIGAHESGLIGENPKGIPNNLMPYITQVAAGIREKLTIFGGDYPTPDGTCRRDYIHVADLADAHVKAIEYADAHTGSEIFNIGTGTPYSVLEIVNTFIDVNKADVPYVIGSRRAGDLADVYADNTKAVKVLGWTPKRGIKEMCRDSYNFIQHQTGKQV